MASPRTSQEFDRESPAGSPRTQFSLFRKKAEREQKERELQLAKTLKATLGSLLLKLDGTTDVSEIQEIAKLVKEHTSSKSQDSNSDSDGDLHQYNTLCLVDLLSAKIDTEMKPLVENYFKDKSHDDEKSMSFDDAMRQLKPKYLSIIFYMLIEILLLGHKEEFTEDEVKQLKKFILEIEYTKMNADNYSQIVDCLFGLSYKNPETKKMVMEGLAEHYMPIYNALLNHCNGVENTQKQTNSQSSTLKI